MYQCLCVDCIVHHCVYVFVLSIAPSAPPDSIRALNVIPSSFDIEWGMVPCIHHNGDITGYSVRYGMKGSANTQITNISGAGVMSTSISDLMPDTSYVVEVAGVNSIGIGMYNTSFTVSTPQS